MKEKKKSRNNDYKLPILISVVLHALLVVVLFWGTDFTLSKPEPSGSMVQAVVIDPDLIRQQAQHIRNKREQAARKEQQRLDKLRRESEQLEKNRKAEEARIRKLKQQQAKEAKAAREAEQHRQAQEKQRKEAAERAKKEQQRAAKLEAERKAKEQAIQKAEQQRLAKEAAIAKAEQQRLEREKAAQEAKEKARREREAAEKAEQQRIAKEKAAKEAAEKARKEKQRLKRLEQERKQQEAALDDIFSGLESEAEANSSARSRHIASEATRYGAIYTQLIKQNLLVDESFRGKKCRVNLRLIPTGAGAILGSLSVLGGDSNVCAASERAVAQVSSFPLPKDPDVINKVTNINLTVEL